MIEENTVENSNDDGKNENLKLKNVFKIQI
jgi:hypothetical protein